jgi:hypothetical protein
MASSSEENIAPDEEEQRTKLEDSGASASVGEVTASSSEYDESDEFDETTMPLLKYDRISGVIPRLPRRVPPTTPSNPLSSACNCVQLGRVLLSRREDGTFEEPSDFGQQPVLLTGHKNGTVSFVHVETGAAIVDSKQLLVNSSGEQSAIVDVSLDASANYLAAINVTGCCAIWEVRYGSPSEAPTQQADVFKSFLTNLKGQSTTPNSDASSNLKTTSVQVSRITYPSSFGPPTCLVLDPGYKRRREKSLLVAFSDGRLILTKRGFVFQRRNDAVIYQATAGAFIEALAWRGTLVAWADERWVKSKFRRTVVL